jgi:hypothetical protein
MPRISTKATIIIMLTAGLAIAAIAQNKDRKHEEHKPVNLKILPDDISHDSLITVMKEYSYALGVRCGFCHAKSATDEKRLDFASDDNGKKKAARYMMKMTAGINKKYFAEENYNSAKRMISCYTCHHGHEEPEAFVMPKEEEKH